MKYGRFLAAACMALLSLSANAEEPAWTSTLERISSGVVSIRVDSTRAFDTEWNSSSQATGFVVDAERATVQFADRRRQWLVADAPAAKVRC